MLDFPPSDTVVLPSVKEEFESLEFAMLPASIVLVTLPVSVVYTPLVTVAAFPPMFREAAVPVAFVSMIADGVPRFGVVLQEGIPELLVTKTDVLEEESPLTVVPSDA